MAKKPKVVGLNVPKKEKAPSEPETFDYDVTTYLAVMNPETKRYDMLSVRIDLDNDKAFIEREPTRYDSPHRALQDTVKMVTREMFDHGDKK